MIFYRFQEVSKFIVLILLFAGYSYASPIRMAALLDSRLVAMPILLQDLDDTRALLDEDPMMYALNDDTKIDMVTEKSFDVQKRSAAETDDDDDLETAAGTNVLRPLFVYRQQVAYRQRAREAIRRGRRI